MENVSTLYLKEESYAIVGAAMKLHAELGCGFLEDVYQEGMEMAFRKFGIPAEAQKELRIPFWGETLKKTYVADFVVYDKIIVEIKALKVLGAPEEAQVLNYLKASGHRLGILINFGAPSLEFKRIVL